MILVYAEQAGPRCQYAIRSLIGDFLQRDIEITTDLLAYRNYDGPKIAYGLEEADQGLAVPSEGLLNRSGIRPLEPDFSVENGLPRLFPNRGKWDLSFDVFSAAFYFLSRYEEYLPFRPDEHGRFPLTESFLFKNKWHQRPLVDEYANLLEAKLLERFPNMGSSTRSYRFQSSIDIDNAWAFLHKGPVRFAGGLIQSLSQGRMEEFKQRIRVVLGKEADPYYCYNKLEMLHRSYEIKPRYFVLLGDYGEYDKNVPHTAQAFRELIRDLADRATVGLHPSYASNTRPELLSEEKSRLEEILNRDVVTSRQHFLKVQLPVTYRRLVDLGVREDHSMGFIEAPAFRAAAASPFHFYDLDCEQSTPLRIFPFQVIDTGFRFYQGLESPEQALTAVEQIVKTTKAVNGRFCPVFHNESPSGYGPWKGWSGFYESVLRIGTDTNETN